ncbi:anti anti-sigma regulatory factor SypA [Vibrio astriarenae]|nr:anti anti-sigma regulatory factor SypA [Vibrio sp. C7]
MELQTHAINEQLLSLAIIGDFDASGSKQAQICIDSLLQGDDHKEIEIDLAQVEFLDSSGIGAIVYFYKRLVEAERQMRIENAHGQPLKMMELLRIGQAIPLNKHNSVTVANQELATTH